jgi:hypothetical protein
MGWDESGGESGKAPSEVASNTKPWVDAVVGRARRSRRGCPGCGSAEYLVADVAPRWSAQDVPRVPAVAEPARVVHRTVRETDPGKGDGGIVTDTGKPLIS